MTCDCVHAVLNDAVHELGEDGARAEEEVRALESLAKAREGSGPVLGAAAAAPQTANAPGDANERRSGMREYVAREYVARAHPATSAVIQ